MGMRLIDADKLDWWYKGRPIRRVIDEAPTVDAVPRGVVDQIRWERDVAIKQLEEHGIPFCGIAPDVVKVVRCKDCKYWEQDGCPMYREELIDWEEDGYRESELVVYNLAHDNGFCDSGERKDNERKAD